MIYLDYNATTPIDPQVAAAMLPFIHEEFGNPSSGHAIGQIARRALDAARASVARLIGAKPGEIVFTSGGTEASNFAIKRTAWLRQQKGRHFVSSVVEHPATLEPLRWLEKLGHEYTLVGVDGDGIIDPDEVRRAIRPDTVLVSIMHAQNEVGTIEPIEEIGRIAKERGVLFHVDAAQSIGKIPVDVSAMQADFVSIAAHKFYGPKGVGALYIREGIELEPFIHGAPQEGGRRGGTENVIMAVGMGKAAELAAGHVGNRHAGANTAAPVPAAESECLGDPGLIELRDLFWSLLSDRLGDRVVLNGHPTRRLPSTINVSFPGHIGGELLAKLDGVCASTGAACHSGDTKPSAVLTAMGVSRERAVGTIRFSVGRPTTREEVVQVAGRIVERLEA